MVSSNGSQAQDQAAGEEMNQDRQDALQFITHELKSSVVGIGGLAKLLMRTEQDPERRKKLKIIYDQAQFLETVSARFLLFGQIEKGELEVKKARIDDFYDEVIRPVLAMFSKDSSAQLRDSREDLEKLDPLELNADRNLMRVVFQNLVGNAIKYCYPNRPIRLQIEELDEEFRFSVWNAGPGVEPAEADKVFDKFYRAKGETAENAKGMGLGLYNTRRIIEAHGGRIWCESEPGESIRFVFSVPKE